jgi:hypothetical protein
LNVDGKMVKVEVANPINRVVDFPKGIAHGK